MVKPDVLPGSQRTSSSKVFCPQKEIFDGMEWNILFQIFCLTLASSLFCLIRLLQVFLTHLSASCLQTMDQKKFWHLKYDLGHLQI